MHCHNELTAEMIKKTFFSSNIPAEKRQTITGYFGRSVMFDGTEKGGVETKGDLGVGKLTWSK